MTLPRLALRLSTSAAATLLFLVAAVIISSPASAAATYTFYASGSAVGQTAPGVSKDYTLNLTNLNSTASISFNLSIVTSPIGWTTQLSQTSLTVAASTTRQITLTVQPPSTALADSVGQYVNVTATPDDNTTAQTVSTTTRVTEVFGVSVTIIPQAGTSGDPGQNISWLAYVKNTGNSPQTYSVNVNNTSFTSTNLTTNLVTVSPGDTRVILVTINISTSAAVGTLYSRMTATSNANSSSSDTKEFSATVNAKRQVALSGLTPDDLKASTEAEASITLHNILVENKGNVPDSYTLQGTANQSRHGDWVSFDSSAISMIAFTQRYLNVTVTVPASITSTGDYTVEFRIISDNSTAVIAFLNLTISVTAKHDLKLTYESLVAKQSGEPGTTVAFPINVSNPGAFDQRVDVNYSGPNSGWVAISASPFTLAPNAFKIVYVNFTIPGTEVPGQFAFQVLGSINWTNPYRNRTVDLTLEVKQVYDAVATTGVAAASGLPGATVTFTIQVRNNGTGADNFTVSATNTTQAGVLSLSSTTLSLAMGASGNVTVSIAITSAPAPLAGVYYYGVTAKSSGNVSKASTVNLALTVNQTYGLTATVSPSYQTADPGATTSYTLSVVNGGNGADTVTLQKTGVNQSWLAFPTGSGTIAAGARMNFSVNVTPPSWALEGDTVLSVKVVSSGDANASSTPTFTVSLNAKYAFVLIAGSASVPNAHRNNTYGVDFTLRNSGNRADSFAIALEGADALWATVPLSNVTLSPNQNITFTVSVRVPSDPTNGPHAFTLNATSLTNASWRATAGFTVTVNDVFKPEVTLLASSYFGEPYTSLSIGYTVRNNGTITDTFAFTATAHFPTSQVLSRNYTLAAGAAASGTFLVNLSYAFSGTYLVDLRAVSLSNSSFDGAAFANITLEVIRAVDAAAAADTAAGGPNDAVDFTLVVRNLGNITDNYTMAYTAPGVGWNLTFAPGAFTLAPGASLNVTATMTAPSVLGPGTFATTVAVTSETVASVRDVLQLRLTVSYDIQLSGTSPDSSLLPGSSATFTALVKNTGSARDQVTLTPTGQVASWAQVSPSVASLASGESATVTVNVAVPAEQHDGLKTFTLEARSTSLTSVFRQVSFSITVLKVYAFTVSAPSGAVDVAPGQNASFTLTIINTGNALDSYSFVANPQAYVTFSPPNATADALQTVNLSVRFTPPAGASAGPQSIQVTVYGSGGNTRLVSLDATVLPVYRVAASGLPGGTFAAVGGPGSDVQLSFNITNRGNGLDSFSWTLSGEAAGWAQVRSGTEVIPPGSVNLTFVNMHIPSDPLVALAGARTLVATVVSQGGGAAVVAVVSGWVTVSDAPAFAMSFDPASIVTSNLTDVDRAAPRTPIDYTLYLQNLGNRNETITITRTTISQWTITVLVGTSSVSQITLRPGEQGTAKLRIGAFPASATDNSVLVTARVADNLAAPFNLTVAVHFLDPKVGIAAGSVQVSQSTIGVGSSVLVTCTVTNTGAGTATNVQVELVVDGQQHVAQHAIPSIAPGQTVDVSLTWTPAEVDAGVSHTVTVETSTGSTAAGSDVQVTTVQKGLLNKILTDRDLQMMMVVGLVIGLAAGFASRRRKPLAPEKKPAAPPPYRPPAGPEAALAGLAALEAEGDTQVLSPAPGTPPEGPSTVEHKVACPNCGTEQWIRGAEGECKTCGVVIEVAEEEAPDAPGGA